ncbi:MAG: 4Fe-4S dicluster domain-containing protein, partial [Acidobacteria bacterium]|nr:4Fe-4S dicluster domain-containing protein [Acidobacteriota bacterium]
AVTFRRCLRVYDEEGGFAPRYDDGDRRTVPCDTALLAVGQATDISFLKDGGADVEEFRPGWPKVDPDSLSTTAPGVFVAGDLAHGTRLLIDAVASGKRAARSVYRHATGRILQAEQLEAHLVLPIYSREPGYESIRRVELPTLTPADRMSDPRAIVEIGYREDQARREASRCLDCAVTPVFDGTRCVLCGGCVDVCPTLCLKLVTLADLEETSDIRTSIDRALGPGSDPDGNSAILKDEDRCIRCGLCALRCPADAITMERVTFAAAWR